MEFLVNYVSIWDKEWFIGLMRLLVDIVSVGAILLFILFVILSIVVWFLDV